MQDRAFKRSRHHARQTEQHIADLRNRRIGKALLEQGLAIRQHRAHEHRDERQGHEALLHPCAAQHVRADQIVDHAQHSQHARLGDDAGKHGGSRSRSNRVRRRQPAVHREHARLGAEADDDQERNQQQSARRARRGLHAAWHERHRSEIVAEEEDAQQTEHRAEDGVHEVLDARGDRLRRALVNDHRHGQQCHQLVEHIQRDHRACIALTNQCGQHAHVEHLIEALVVVMPHVFAREYAGKQPHRAHQHGEDAADDIDVHFDAKRRGHVQQNHLRALAEAHDNRQQQLNAQCRADSLPAQLFVFLQGRRQEDGESGKRRPENRQNQKNVHGFFLLVLCKSGEAIQQRPKDTLCEETECEIQRDKTDKSQSRVEVDFHFRVALGMLVIRNVHLHRRA